MFSIALCDKNSKNLFLSRDRIGEKPLYYGWQGDAFLFSSELENFFIISSASFREIFFFNNLVLL